jgi:hypothetical protein
MSRQDSAIVGPFPSRPLPQSRAWYKVFSSSRDFRMARRIDVNSATSNPLCSALAIAVRLAGVYFALQTKSSDDRPPIP